MNPQTALAEVVVDELCRLGVTDAVLAPGSRSAPLAYALHAADAAGRLRLHVRVDERSAAFLALGLAKASGTPAPVVTTSGTAVANLLPAVMEAHESAVPMLLLTADRPPELRGTRANQTTDQLGLYGGFVRWFHDLGVPEPRVGAQASWRTSLDRAVAAATGQTGGDPGPVHLNLPLRDPLAPDPNSDVQVEIEGGWPESLMGRPDGGPWTRVGPADARHAAAALAAVARTLVVLGDASPSLHGSATAWANRHGHPIVGEPFGPWGEGRLPHGVTVAARADEPELCPERVVVVGRLTLSRALARLLRLPGVRVELVTDGGRWADPGHVVAEVHPQEVFASASAELGEAGGDVRPGGVAEDARVFRDRWVAAAVEAGREVEEALSWPSGPALAEAVLGALPAGALLFLGSSNGVRYVDLVRGRLGGDDVDVVASRGLAGIDGCVSTAAGMALASGRPTYAFLGDLTFLHDANGLLIGPEEPRVDLTIVVGNDDGGAIFAGLEYGQTERRRSFPGVFERVFRTPTGTDIAALCRAHGVRHVAASTPEAVREVLADRPQGITVVEVSLPAPIPGRAGPRSATG